MNTARIPLTPAMLMATALIVQPATGLLYGRLGGGLLERADTLAATC